MSKITNYRGLDERKTDMAEELSLSETQRWRDWETLGHKNNSVVTQKPHKKIGTNGTSLFKTSSHIDYLWNFKHWL